MPSHLTLSLDHLRRLENFGHSISAPAYVFRPTHAEQVAHFLREAQERNLRVALRGAGRSYGDPHMASGGVVLDLRRMNRILAWNPDSGEITVEPGVTIERLWQYALEDGWWPAVVPGTMKPTIGGCLAANVHGKNNWLAGTIGEHVTRLRALLPTGEEVTLSPDDDLFPALVSSMGTLGVFTEIALRLHKVHSGELEVGAWSVPHLKQMLDDLDAHKESSDYVVAWLDGTARGKGLGRGQIHVARYLEPGEDRHPARTLALDYQTLPENILFVPKSVLWMFMRPFMNRLGLWGINTAKYLSARTLGNHKTFRQSHAAFNFLLDYVPHWERAYGKGGLIQYQCFVPKENAYEAFREVLETTHRHSLPTYLGVVKRHRPDRFLLSHAVDGFSLAMDFRVTKGNRRRLQDMADALNRIVLQAGGRFYLAKDATLTPDAWLASLGEDTLRRYFDLKAQLDPNEVLQTDQYRRLFAPLKERFA